MRWLISLLVLLPLLALAVLSACGESSDPNTSPIDGAIDTPAGDPCLRCAVGQICVARYNGTCGVTTDCVAQTVACPLNACSQECQTAYCPSPYQCMTRSPCGGESDKAFTCYGP
jgi:hypothetical protein